MAEILHQLIGSLSHDLQGLYIPGGDRRISEPSTVSSTCHQPFPWNSRGPISLYETTIFPQFALNADPPTMHSSFTKPPFGGNRSGEVAIIWPDR